VGASKIAPHELHAFRELGVALLQVVDVFSHCLIVHTKFENRKSKLDEGGGICRTFREQQIPRCVPRPQKTREKKKRAGLRSG